MPEQDPYSAIAKPIQAQQTSDPYAAIAKPISPPSDDSSEIASPSFLQNFMHPANAPGGDENSSDMPLTSYGAATRAGFNSIANDTISVIKGALAFADPRPQSDSENTALGLGGPAALYIHRLVESGHGALKTLPQVAAALEDIRRSPDPTGTFLKVAQRTASQGAGAALTALGPEGLVKGAGAVAGKVKGVVAPVQEASPVESAVSTAAARSGLPEGAAASTAPSGADIQPTLQQGIRDTVDKIAKKNGLEPVQADIRNIGKGLGDRFFTRSKATFQKIEDITGVDLTNLREKISTLADKISQAVDDPEKAGQLEQQKLSLENTADKAFNDAKLKGIDADQARDDWKKYNSSYEFGQHIRNSAEGTLDDPIINPSKLAPRLQKFSESTSPTQPGRLQQLAGADHASTLVEAAENARTATQAIKEFVPSSPTGQQALQGLLRANTEGKAGLTGKVSGRTDWNKAVGSFENLSPAEQTARFGSDVDKVRQFLGKQAQRQIALNLLKKAVVGTASAAGLGAAGTLGYELVK